MDNSSNYDAVIVGAGHNGLIAACYLAMGGLRVLILEKNDAAGGATRSSQIFSGVDAQVSVYSYLVSLLPKKILSDLGLDFEIQRRKIASYTPVGQNGSIKGLLISNSDETVTRNSFFALTGSDREYRRYVDLQAKLCLFAQKVWPTLLLPLRSKADLRQEFKTRDEVETWEYIVEKPLSELIEESLLDDTVRGVVFTDAKIGVSTFPEDPSLLQNRTFIYHVIGQGSGEWSVPVGGMGRLVSGLTQKAQSLGVVIHTSAEVLRVEYGASGSTVYFVKNEKEVSVTARFVLFNCAANIANRCLPGALAEDLVEGSVFKINMVLKKLPAMKDPWVSPAEAFSGTFHLYEGYEHMKTAQKNAQAGIQMDNIPGEMYCHSLTDPSILSQDLQEKGYHTLTLFGLDVPYAWFSRDNATKREEVLRNFLASINHFIEGDLLDCLATDTNGDLCIEAKSPLDLEASLGLPMGNIFHGNLSWPFAVKNENVGAWGVETNYKNVLMCGSGALRGGAVSGIPGHNAAMKALEGLKHMG